MLIYCVYTVVLCYHVWLSQPAAEQWTIIHYYSVLKWTLAPKIVLASTDMARVSTKSRQESCMYTYTVYITRVFYTVYMYMQQVPQDHVI